MAITITSVSILGKVEVAPLQPPELPDSITSPSSIRAGRNWRALYRLVDYGVPIDGASDHGVSEAIYLRDPDGNGIEIYRDRPRDDWPRDPDGSFTMMTAPLDLRALLHELDS